VARDRQRAKQRRSRQAGAGGSRPARQRNGGATPTPDPLKHAFPDVEEAELAEAGGTPPDVGEELPPDMGQELPTDVGPELPAAEIPVEDYPELEREADDLEADRDLASASSMRRDAERMEREATEEHRRRVGRGKLITFLGHVVDELRRVQWPDRRQVGQGTLVTLLFVLIAGGYLGLLDAIWKPVIEAIL
jgi:preprotein translocase SecE subunit